jgi:Ni/Fe-hydrogenase subunit HybB-like protein
VVIDKQPAVRGVRRYLRVSFWVEVIVGGLLAVVIVIGSLVLDRPLMCLVALVPGYIIFRAVRTRRKFTARLEAFDQLPSRTEK